MIEQLVVSVLIGYGIAITLVEKGDVWPVKPIYELLKKGIGKISPKFAEVLNCSVCTSFWTTLVGDAIMCYYYSGHYWLWPLSGFVTLSLTWTLIQFMNVIEEPKLILRDRSDHD